MNKLCPLSHNMAGICKGNLCAWWDETYRTCSISAIASHFTVPATPDDDTDQTKSERDFDIDAIKAQIKTGMQITIGTRDDDDDNGIDFWYENVTVTAIDNDDNFILVKCATGNTDILHFEDYGHFWTIRDIPTQS